MNEQDANNTIHNFGKVKYTPHTISNKHSSLNDRCMPSYLAMKICGLTGRLYILPIYYHYNYRHVWIRMDDLEIIEKLSH